MNTRVSKFSSRRDFEHPASSPHTLWVASLFLFLLPLILHMGCASSIDLGEMDSKTEGGIDSLLHEESVVFGRINVVSDGRPVNWPNSTAGKVFRFGAGEFRVLVHSETGSKVFSYTLTDDGSFAWHLPPGNHAIAGYEWHARPGGPNRLSGRIWAEFLVHDKGALIYIGTLVINFLDGRYSMTVEDNFNEALTKVSAEFPYLNGPRSKQLVRLEKGP